MRRFIRGVAVALALVALILPVLPDKVLAIADPDSPPQLTSVYVYNLADGGIGILSRYFLDYAVLPTVADANDTATNAYLVSFIDIDGTTVLRSTQPYVFVDSGYGYGLTWIRFSAAEVATLSIDSADEALYTVRIEGNPTIPSGWAGDPPLTVVGITDWYTTGDPEVLLAAQVRIYADQLELDWGGAYDLIESSALGNVLTVAGENYFLNVVPGLRILAPAVFSASVLTPALEDIDYSTTFSAIAASVAGGATVVGSPQTLLVNVVNTVDTGATTGDMTITLSNAATGTIAEGTGTFVGSAVYAVGTVTVTNADATVTGAGGATWTTAMNGGIFLSTDGVYYMISSVTSATTLELTVVYGGATLAGQVYEISSIPLVAGVNTINVNGAGTFMVALTQTDLQAQIDTGSAETGFDVEDAATIFGMTRGVLSTSLWLILGVVLIGASYGVIRKGDILGSQESSTSAGKTAMFLYGIWMIAGLLLGVLLAKVIALLFIGYGAFVGYIIFYRGSAGDTGRNVAFMGWMWVVVCLAGGMLNGLVPQASTHLTANLTDAGVVVNVASTEGFRTPGILIIDGERVAYYDITANTFIGTTFRPLVRGAGGTEAVAHLSGVTVRMPESALINDSLDYNIALISDSAGLMAFVTVPLAVWNIITDFLFLPLSFLGTDLVIITVIWGIIALGVIITAFMAIAGGRRV